MLKNVFYTILVLVCILFYGCEPAEDRFEVVKEYDKKIVYLTVVVYDDRAELQKEYEKHMAKNGGEALQGKLFGWSAWYKNPKNLKCTMHVPVLYDTRESDKFKTWGHELAHCIHGQFHKDKYSR